MADTSAPIALGLGGLASVLILSGFQNRTLGEVLKGELGHNSSGSGASGSEPSAGGTEVLSRGAGKFGALTKGNLSYAGPDQGIDFTGKGTLLAPERMTITHVSTHSGWPGGGLVVGQLLEGPHKGRYIYYAEAIAPSVQVGQVVPKGGVIATLNSSYPGTEIGWASDPAGSAYGTIQDGKPGGPAPVHGEDFLHYISSL